MKWRYIAVRPISSAQREQCDNCLYAATQRSNSLPTKRNLLLISLVVSLPLLRTALPRLLTTFLLLVHLVNYIFLTGFNMNTPKFYYLSFYPQNRNTSFKLEKFFSTLLGVLESLTPFRTSPHPCRKQNPAYGLNRNQTEFKLFDFQTKHDKPRNLHHKQ